jgi:hypothetical protein
MIKLIANEMIYKLIMYTKIKINLSQYSSYIIIMSKIYKQGVVCKILNLRIISILQSRNFCNQKN